MIEYKFKKGDCLTKLAKRFNTTVEKIAALNGITNVDYIAVGDIILIGDKDECNNNK